MMSPTFAPRRHQDGSEALARLSILVPVYNERKLLPTVLARIAAAPTAGLGKEIILVDDCSTDGTREYLRSIEHDWRPELLRAAAGGGISLPLELLGRCSLRVVYHPRNRGKGAGLRTAIAAATGDLCIVQDADLEYNPAEYPRLLRPIMDGRAEVVYGSRYLADPGGSRRVMRFWHTLANRLLTLASNALSDLTLTDMETCYKVFPTGLLKSLRLTSDRFGFEPEVTARLAKRRVRIYEVPISYQARSYAEGKKIGWRDAIAAFWHIARFNLRPDPTAIRFAGTPAARAGLAGANLAAA
jgi:glycosyltransferase involved in cell wall biosynthesis